MNLREQVFRTLAPSIYSKLEERVEATMGNLDLISESFAAMADIAREDRDYTRIGESHQKFFSAESVRQLIMQARLYYLKNPIVKRGVDIQKFYVFGKGVTVRSEDETTNKAIQEFFAVNDKLLGNVGLTSLEAKMQTDGNLFVAAFVSGELGSVQLRRIDALEVSKILCHPDDAETELAYLRSWNVVKGDKIELKQEWYPAMFALASDIALISGSLEGVPMNTTPVYHQHIEALGTSPWGIPEFYAAIDWARSYKEFLEGWSSIQSIFRGFGFQANTDGGQKKIDAIKNSLQTSISTGTTTETNPSPQTGSTFVGGPNTKLAAIKTAGATEGPEEARRLFLMSVMVFGAPETMYGDASVGTLATATALDRPTELKFKLAQERWKVFLRNITEYAVMKGKEAPGSELRKLKDTNTQASVIVEFPDILEHDIEKIMKAAVSLFTLDGKTSGGTWDIRSFALFGLQLLGVDDPETIVEALYPKGDYKAEDWASLTPEEKQQQVSDMADKAAAAAKGGGGDKSAQESALAELARIGQAILKESNAGASA